MIKIITDSGSDILADTCEGVRVVPLHVSFEEEHYLDGVDLAHETFYEKLIETDVLPKTSQISPYEFLEAYREEFETGQEEETVQLLVITLSSKLSGTYQSACIAAEEYEKQVYVVDSENVAVGEHCLVMRAVELVQMGKSIDEVVTCLEKEKKELQVIALLDTLEYLKKGGRISATAAMLGGALSIKPVVGVEDGEVVVLGKAHGSKNGKNLLIQRTQSVGGIDFSRPFCLGYTGLSDQLIRKYIDDSHILWEKDCKKEELPVVSIGAAIGTHVGPGAIALAFFAS